MQRPATSAEDTTRRAHVSALRRTKQVGVVRVSVDHLRPAPRADGSPAPVASYGRLLDIDATREFCGGRSKSWIYRGMNSGEFVPGIYIGRSLFFPERWVEHWIAAQVESQHPLDLAQVANSGAKVSS